MKLCLAVSTLLILIVPVAQSEVNVISKSQLPTVFRSPADYDMQSEQWLYKATDDFLLFGGGTRGTIYAAYHFLEDVHGVHWWTPWGEETVPSSPATISGNPTLAGVPAFPYREIHGGIDDNIEKPFYAKNRCNGRIAFLGANYGWSETFGLPAMVHTFGRYISADQYFSTHPEYFALVDGVRNPNQLCMSNDDVYNIILTQLTQYIAQDQATALDGGRPMPRYYDLSQNDSTVYCQCATCAALIQAQGNAPSATVLNLVNRLAAAIKTSYPNVKLSTLAYQETEKAPSSLQAESNVAIRLAGINNDFAQPFSANTSFDNNIQAWSNLANHLYIWHYLRTYGENYAHNFVLNNLAGDLQYCLNHNVEAVFLEHEFYPFSVGVTWDFNNWAAIKLMENPNLSLDSLTETFCNGYYGSTAGAAIRQYMNQISSAATGNTDYHTWRSTIADYSYINDAFVTTAGQHWADAASAASGVQLQRVTNARMEFDRYVLHAGQRLIDEYAAAHGGSASGFTAAIFDLAQAASRSITAINNLPAERFPTTYFPAAVKSAAISDMNAFSTAFQTPTPSSALPSQIANYTHVVLYPGDFSFNGGSDCRLVIDPLLPTKLAVQMDNWSPANGGTYDFVACTSTSFTFPTISETQYQWVELGSGTISPTSYLYFLSSWNSQVSHGAYAHKNGITSGKIWGEFRYDSAANQMYVNRIAVVLN